MTLVQGRTAVSAKADGAVRATTRERPSGGPFRKTARVIGAMYVAGFVVGIVGEGLIQSVIGTPNHLATVSASALTLAIGVVLWLIAVAGDAAHGVLMFPVLKPVGERLAVGYLAARILDAAFIAIMALFLALQIPLGSEYLKAAAADLPTLQALSTVLVQASQYAYQFGMITLGVSGLTLSYALYKAKLLPRALSIWGLVGYTVIFAGMISQVMGSGLGLASSIPGGLWEAFVGFWLIFKGFSAPSSASTAKVAASR